MQAFTPPPNPPMLGPVSTMKGGASPPRRMSLGTNAPHRPGRPGKGGGGEKGGRGEAVGVKGEGQGPGGWRRGGEGEAWVPECEILTLEEGHAVVCRPEATEQAGVMWEWGWGWEWGAGGGTS